MFLGVLVFVSVCVFCHLEVHMRVCHDTIYSARTPDYSGLISILIPFETLCHYNTRLTPNEFARKKGNID